MTDPTPPNPWDRRLWGVLFDSGSVVGPRLISATWDDELTARAYYPGEPRRPLLFHTRAQARAWCRRHMDQIGQWRARGNFVARWALRPVRVREVIDVEHVRPAGRHR